METILAIVVSTINTRPLAIFEGMILSPMSWGQHDFTLSTRVPSNNTVSMLTEISEVTENNITGNPDIISADPEAQKLQVRKFKKTLSTMAMRIDRVYESHSINLLPELLKSYYSSGAELNKSQFNTDYLQISDIAKYY